MAERTKWDFVDENKVPQTDEPVSVEKFVWGENAPVTRCYDPNARKLDVPASTPRTDGWAGQTPYSDEHNFIWKLNSLLLAEMEKRGVLNWSEVTNYTPPAIVWGSNGELYKCLIASGPDSGGSKNPVTEPVYWSRFAYDREKFISGLVPTLQPTNAITVSKGAATSSNNEIDIIRLETPITKTVATWAPGDNQGGFFGGVYPSARFHFFVIKNPSTNEVDVGFSFYPNAPDRPPEYTEFRRIFSCYLLSYDWWDFKAFEDSGGCLDVRFPIPNPIYNDAITTTSQIIFVANLVPQEVGGVSIMKVSLCAELSSTDAFYTGGGTYIRAILADGETPDIIPDTNRYSLRVSTNSRRSISNFSLNLTPGGGFNFRAATDGSLTQTRLYMAITGYFDRRNDTP